MKTCVMGKFQLQLIAYFENILNSMKVLNVLTVIYLHTHFFFVSVCVCIYIYIYIERERERAIYGKEAVHFSTLLLLNDRSLVLKL